MKYSIIYSALITATLTACSSGGGGNGNVHQQTETAMPSASANQTTSKISPSTKTPTSEKSKSHSTKKPETEVRKQSGILHRDEPSTENVEKTLLPTKQEDETAPEIREGDKKTHTNTNKEAQNDDKGPSSTKAEPETKLQTNPVLFNDYQGDGLQNQQQLVFHLPEINGKPLPKIYDINKLLTQQQVVNHTILIEDSGISLQLYTGTLGQEKNIASYIAWFNGASSEGRNAAAPLEVDQKTEMQYYVGGNDTLKVNIKELPADFSANYDGSFIFNKNDEAPKSANLAIRINNKEVSGEVKDSERGTITYFNLAKGSDMDNFFFEPSKKLKEEGYGGAGSTPNYYNSSDSAKDARYLNGKVNGDNWKAVYHARQ